MKKTLFLLLIGICNITNAFATSPLVAFPGAEGFGKYAAGGRGGKVVAVTNLDDYLATETPVVGSFRWALSQYITSSTANNNGTATAITIYTPLTIVFKVSGTIWLKEDLKINRDSLTIAGQTAPGDGICIAGRSVLFNGATGGQMFYWGPRRKDIIIRYIRFRPGFPKNTDGTPLISSSVVTYGTDMENYENAIFDHCSISWANEECFATYDTKNITVQWCIESEGLYCAYHKKGLRSYGGVWGGQFASYHHNLIAHQNSRAARFDGSRAHDTIAVIDYRNNVIYNWGSNNDAIYGGEIEIPNGRSEINMQNNYYKKGPVLASASTTPSASNKAHRLVLLYDAASPIYGRGNHYINGNYVYNYPTVTANNWQYGVQYKYYSDTTTANPLFRKTSPSSEVTQILPSTLETAEDSYTSVLNGVGATLPLRDAQDKRIINETKNGTATGYGSIASYTNNGSTFSNGTFINVVQGIIDNPAVVGGWPVLNTGTILTDTDNDGMPDVYENAHSLNPADSTDGNGIAASGYTNLEEYLNSISQNTSFIQAPFNLKASATVGSNIQLIWVDNTDIEENYEVQRAIRGTGNFTTIATLAANSTSYTDNTLPDTTYVYRVRATNASAQSAYSNEADFLQAPDMGTIVLSTSTPTNKPVISWFDYSNSESSYEIYRSNTGGDDFTLLATVSSNIITYTDTSALDGTTYYYKVAAKLGTLKSMSSQILSIKTTFVAPTGLTISLNSQNKPSLTWVDGSVIEDGYEIQRTLSTPVVYTIIDTVPANTTSFIDTTAIAGNSYTYKVRAITSTQQSAFTSAITISIPTGINESKIAGLKVYPNPVVDLLTIEANEIISEVAVYNITGTLIQKANVDTKQVNIPMKTLPTGIYTVKINGRSGNQTTVKVVK